MNKNILAVVAHADDEAIGCGGTLIRHKEAGDYVVVVVCTKLGEVRQAEEKMLEAVSKCRNDFDFHYVFFDLPDQKLDTLPILQLNQLIERVIENFKPDIIYTHSKHDLNQDHVTVHNATVVAARFVNKLLFFHIPSPGEFSTFQGNYFSQIAWTPKEQFLLNYASEMRDTPHPRSFENLKAKTQVEGSKANFLFAESFEVGRWADEFASTW